MPAAGSKDDKDGGEDSVHASWHPTISIDAREHNDNRSRHALMTLCKHLDGKAGWPSLTNPLPQPRAAVKPMRLWGGGGGGGKKGAGAMGVGARRFELVVASAEGSVGEWTAKVKGRCV